MITVLLCSASCAMDRQREQVRQGFLTAGLHRGAFLKEWGIPSRTYAVPRPASAPCPRYDAPSWQCVTYEIWEYQSHATCLTFDGVRLVSWETERTDCAPEPADETRAEPAPPYPPRR
jgi:hypothetical protein